LRTRGRWVCVLAHLPPPPLFPRGWGQVRCLVFLGHPHRHPCHPERVGLGTEGRRSLTDPLVREQTSWGVTLTVCLPGLGTVRLVVRVAHERLRGTSVVRVTNRVDGSAATIISLDGHRWPTATSD
jgi:hypothetical protein